MIDVCGTGGDPASPFSTSSTTVAFVLAGGGATVVKHGQPRRHVPRAAGADVLAALGVPLDLSPAALRRRLEKRRASVSCSRRSTTRLSRPSAPVRRQLCRRRQSARSSICSAPLLNPARPNHQLVGIFTAGLTETYAEVLRQLGRRSVWVVHGTGGMDELSTLGRDPGQPLRPPPRRRDHPRGTSPPAQAGLPPNQHSGTGLLGGTAEDNARVPAHRHPGRGDRRPRGATSFCSTPAAGFVVAGLSEDLPAGVKRARETISSRRAWQVLEAAQENPPKPRRLPLLPRGQVHQAIFLVVRRDAELPVRRANFGRAADLAMVQCLVGLGCGLPSGTVDFRAMVRPCSRQIRDHSYPKKSRVIRQRNEK